MGGGSCMPYFDAIYVAGSVKIIRQPKRRLLGMRFRKTMWCAGRFAWPSCFTDVFDSHGGDGGRLMNQRHKNFLGKLADLLEKYKADCGYTTDDDGVHLRVDGDEVFVGFLDSDSCIKELRAAARITDKGKNE